ncbi:MAG: hypothetical protein ABL881_03935 [Novosphingobium sp.]
MTGAIRAGMAAAMNKLVDNHPGPGLLAHEARVTYGPVPRELGGQAMPPGSILLEGEQFLLRTLTGFGLHYCKGEGVTIERDPGADPVEESLWLNGSTYAAIAAIHGFLPFHASAVVWRGQAYAFTGPSGVGKSTLAAALGQHGLPLLCDDTLVLDVSNPGQILCLPGHKRLKLTDDAFALTGAERLEKVAVGVDKHYAVPPGGILAQVVPLARLTFLEDAVRTGFEPIIGGERIARLNDDHYTAELYAMARSEGLAERFARISRVARHIPMERLTRPRDPAQFATLAAQIASRIKEAAE